MRLAALAAFATALIFGVPAMAQPASPKPTIVLVHGAFADSSSWNGVIERLQKDGYQTLAVANPLRSVKGDAATVGAVLDSLQGPVVLVGHSYGGAVITEAAKGHANVEALVYVAAFMPDVGESSLALSGKFPGSSLGDALAQPVKTPDGGADLYIQQDKFPRQFASDVASSEAVLMAATQRPIAQAALVEPSGEPAWKSIPSWSVYGTADLNIPPAAMRFMSERAGSKRTLEIANASHVVMISHPAEVAGIIREAAQ